MHLRHVELLLQQFSRWFSKSLTLLHEGSSLVLHCSRFALRVEITHCTRNGAARQTHVRLLVSGGSSIIEPQSFRAMGRSQLVLVSSFQNAVGCGGCLVSSFANLPVGSSRLPSRRFRSHLSLVTLTLKEIIGSGGRNSGGMAQDVGHEFLGRKRAAPNYLQRSIGLPEKGVLLGVRAMEELVNCCGLNDPVAALAGTA
jgi:hypothetical protein